jgi:S-adenosylmethionine synthetase
MSYKYFTSESVCAGHPDKLCDQVSDAIVDSVLAQDPYSHLGVETMATGDRLILAGEIQTTAKVDYESIARREIRRLGYTNRQFGFDDSVQIDILLRNQSPEIAVGVDNEGAGDQGMMFGFACRETPEFMPLPIVLAHKLTRALDEAKTGKLPYLRPDGKAQVTVRYDRNRPVGVSHVTIAVPHDPAIDLDQVKTDVYDKVVRPVLNDYGFELDPRQLVVNGTGIWHLPGPRSDAGLTGRKIVADTYGGYAHVGGGCFSGKDPTKVDRSGAYAARYLAKNIVANGLADRAEVALAYYIGGKKPVMAEVETFGTKSATVGEIQKYIAGLLDLSVEGIIQGLDLRRAIYKQTAAYGHFGRADVPWEQVG